MKAQGFGNGSAVLGNKAPQKQTKKQKKRCLTDLDTAPSFLSFPEVLDRQQFVEYWIPPFGFFLRQINLQTISFPNSLLVLSIGTVEFFLKKIDLRIEDEFSQF